MYAKGILGPSFKVVPDSQVKLLASKYVPLGSAIRPLFTEPVTYILILVLQKVAADLINPVATFTKI